MTDNVKNQVPKAEVKDNIDLEKRLEEITKQLDEKKQEIRMIEQKMVQNQKQLQAAKDSAMSAGLELQGQQKLLLSLLGKSGEAEVNKGPVDLEEARNRQESK